MKDGLLKVGTYNGSEGKVDFTRNFTESYSEVVQGLQIKTVSKCYFHTQEQSIYPAKVYIETLSGEGLSEPLVGATSPAKVRYMLRATC